MVGHAEDAAGLLKAIANPSRLLILCCLADGEMSVGALNEQIALSQSALSQHLAVLREDGLVRTRRESQSIYYSVAPGPASEILRVLHAHYCEVRPPESTDGKPATAARRPKGGQRRS